MRVDRRHVDEHIEPAETVDRPVDDSLTGVRLAQVGLQERRAPPEGADRARGLLGFGLRLVVDQRDVGTATRQFSGDDGADARPAGDQRDSTVEVHGPNTNEPAACLLRFTR